ncbi:hypothetical protein BKA70DRAFT_1488748 [Coprinopsis sp. MPI-PUGE-AT-0042]|nr:hypothetical protein BKA70DRAFT_1488748 [Coprinopsis sp. MPI-PUGE-AT-0042]
MALADPAVSDTVHVPSKNNRRQPSRIPVSAGRPQGAIESLHLISRFSGSEMTVELDYIPDRPEEEEEEEEEEPVGVGVECPTNLRALLPAKHTLLRLVSSQMEVELDDVWEHHHPEEQAALQGSLSVAPAKLATPPAHQRATSRTVLIEEVGVGTGDQANPFEEDGSGQHPPYATTSAVNPSDPDYQRPATPCTPRPPHLRRQSSTASRRSRALLDEQMFCWALLRAVRKPLWAWWDRVTSARSGVVEDDIVAYTMFNVFLPKLLETGTALEPKLSSAPPKGLEGSVWDAAIFTIGECPGAILGAYLIKSRLGPRWTLVNGGKHAHYCVLLHVVRDVCVVMLKEEPRGASGPGGVEKEGGRPLAVH